MLFYVYRFFNGNEALNDSFRQSFPLKEKICGYGYLTKLYQKTKKTLN